MRTFNIVVERDPDTDLYVGYVPGWPGHTAKAPRSTSFGAICKKCLPCCLRTRSRASSPSSLESRRSKLPRRGLDPGTEASRSCCASGAVASYRSGSAVRTDSIGTKMAAERRCPFILGATSHQRCCGSRRSWSRLGRSSLAAGVTR